MLIIALSSSSIIIQLILNALAYLLQRFLPSHSLESHGCALIVFVLQHGLFASHTLKTHWRSFLVVFTEIKIVEIGYQIILLPPHTLKSHRCSFVKIVVQKIVLNAERARIPILIDQNLFLINNSKDKNKTKSHFLLLYVDLIEKLYSSLPVNQPAFFWKVHCVLQLWG